MQGPCEFRQTVAMLDLLKLVVILGLLAQTCLAADDTAEPKSMEKKPKTIEICQSSCKSGTCEDDTCVYCMDGACCREDGCTGCINRCRQDCKTSKCSGNCFDFCYTLHGYPSYWKQYRIPGTVNANAVDQAPSNDWLLGLMQQTKLQPTVQSPITMSLDQTPLMQNYHGAVQPSIPYPQYFNNYLRK